MATSSQPAIRSTKEYIVLLTILASCLFVHADQPKYFMAACAMIKNEMNVLLEWIEFHRIQGVEKFIFVDDYSVDDVQLLPRLYADLGYPDLVEIIPQNFRRYNKPHDGGLGDHDQGQMQGLNHCNTRFKGVAEWMLVCDVDEFMYSPKYHTIANYLRKQTTDQVDHVSVQVMRYGSNGVQNENRLRLSLDPYSNQITVIADVFNENLLLISRNPFRGPFPGVDKDYEKLHTAICKPEKYPHDCQHAIGKSIWRPLQCGLGGIHWCEKRLKGLSNNPRMEELRINHYAFRSKEHVEKLPKNQMGGIKSGVYTVFDRKWFSIVEDNATQPYHAELLERLAMFPTVTVHHKKVINSDWLNSFLSG